MFPYSCTVKSNDGSTIYAEFSDNEPCPVIINDNGFKCLDDAGEDYEVNAELWTLSNGAIRNGANIILPLTIKGFSTTQGVINPDTDFSIGVQTHFANIERETLFTVVETVSRKSVDLTTLPGWEALSSGTYDITIVAKADGFKDSAPSAAVQVVKVVNYTITANLTNCTGASSNPTTIASNTTGTVLTFTANTGYDLPATVTVTGADSSWEAGTGTLTLTNATGPVTVTVVGVATATTIDGGTYKWLDNASLTEWTQEINFTSDGTSYTAMRYTGNGTAMTLQYRYGGSDWVTVYNYDEDASTGSWVNDAYKIVDLGTSAQTVTAIFKADFIANTTSAYDYAFDETMGVLTLNNAPHSQSGDTLTIL